MLAPLLLLSVGVLQANPVTYTFTGTGTGTLAPTPLATTSFTNANFVVTLTSDTGNVALVPSLGNIPAIVGLPANINISGLGDLNFTGTTFIFAVPAAGEVGFGEDNTGFFSPPGNLIQITNAVLSGYNLTTSATASGANGILSQFNNAATNGGPLSFSSMSTVTFVANVSPAPEPGSILLTGAALLGLAVLAARRAASRPALR